MHWTECQHSAYVRDRYYSGGWEFETREGAVEYVTDQYRKQTAEALSNTPFSSTVNSNGVAIHFRHPGYVWTSTYRKSNDTMRDLIRVPSPSDCIWIVPNTEG